MILLIVRVMTNIGHICSPSKIATGKHKQKRTLPRTNPNSISKLTI